MTKTPDTYETVEEAIEVIETAARCTGALGHVTTRMGWNDLIRMRDDVSPEVFERGVRAYSDNEQTVQYLIRETERRAQAHVSTLLASVPRRQSAPLSDQ